MSRTRLTPARLRFSLPSEALRRVALAAGLTLLCGGATAQLATAQGALSVEPVGGNTSKGVGPVKGKGRDVKRGPEVGVVRRGLTLPDPPGTYAGWQAGVDRAVTALAQGSDGALWVATEDVGVWRYASSAASDADKGGATRKVWTQFRAKDGLGDDSAYALAVDKQGRVWAGTLNHGVSVWNGKAWKNYGVLDGPLGERVFDIAVCPTDGDVWIATNAGLTRYSQQKDTWSYFTRADGLPSDQVQALAFNKSGDIVLGTQYDGVAIASAADGYGKWRLVSGPERMPLTPTGTGLPSSLINDVLVARDGTIYVATTTGLAWSGDDGANWRYVRGQDYAAKVRGLYGGAPAGWKAAENPGVLLVEDYVSCLAQDNAGRLWLGHWIEGSEVVEMGDPAGGVKAVVGQENGGFVREILPVADNRMLLARYDRGISRSMIKPEEQSTATEKSLQLRVTSVNFPSAMGVPTGEELQRLLELVRNRARTPEATRVVQLPDDWTTQGDWLGRYGRYWMVACAFNSPQNYVWGAGASPVGYNLRISPQQKNDSIRYWVHWLSTPNPRVLEMPPVYGDSRLQKGLAKAGELRRQSEVDDHGEAYPLTKEGPNIYASLKIPAGLYTLSFYNHNKDGHAGMQRMRDYRISVRSRPAGLPLGNINDFAAWPEVARSRQRDFWGGVYQKFLVRGPQELTIEFNRNNSYNTILAGIFLDEVNEQPSPYFAVKKTRNFNIAEPHLPESAAVNRLWAALEKAKKDNPAWWATESRRFYAPLVRWHQLASQRTAPEGLPRVYSRLGTSYYGLNLFESWEETQRRRGLRTARDIEKSLTWDCKLYDERGKGRRIITAFLNPPENLEEKKSPNQDLKK